MTRIVHYVAHITHHALCIAWCVFLLTACRFPGTVQPTVKIGLVAPFEGRYRYVGYDVIYAVRLAVREVNAAGGVGGYSVELVAYDDGADPAMAVEQARKLAVDPDVVAAIGHFREETTGAAVSAYVEAGIPLVAPAVFDPTLTEGEAEVYRLAPLVESVASVLLQRLDEWGQDQVALVTDGGPLGTALQQLASFHSVVSPLQVDWLDQVMASGVGTVLCDADPVTAGEVVAALRSAGWQGAFLGGPELAASDFVAVAEEAAEGAVFVTPWPFPTDVPDGTNFADRYRAASNGVSPGPLALPAYEATWVLLEALERDVVAHGEPTREGIVKTLPTTGRSGWLGVITLDADRSWDGALLYWYQIGTDGVPSSVQ